MAHPLLHYAGGHLDRAGARRKDIDWLELLLSDPQTRLVPVWRNRNLIQGLDDGTAAQPTAVLMARTDAAPLLRAVDLITFLGLDAGTAVFAADLSPLDARAASAVVEAGTFADLRHAGPLLPPRDAALLAYARGLLHWHRHHPYCARCGHRCESRQGGHMRLCTNAACNHEHFPRTDPAVIMLVELHTPGGSPRCLLGRHSRFPARAFSTLAGFVDPGESLEEAVAREVLEEVGLAVHNIRYQGSQPWPFPASIMLGFRAEAITPHFTVDQDEIQEARWFSVEALRQAGEWQEDSADVRLPRQDSIARFLIESWIEDVT